MAQTVSPSRIADLIERLGRLLRGSEHAHDLNPAQWEALRYLARANRVSRYPGALCDYLGATKGTVSQTLIALERKQLITRQRDSENGRKIALDLTQAGRQLLREDPLMALEAAAGDLDENDRVNLQSGLINLLGKMLARRGNCTFGLCQSCRFFAAGAGTAKGQHHCHLLQVDLSDVEAEAICVEHQPG